MAVLGDHHHSLAFSFGILGNIVSILVYLAPMPTFMRIYRQKSTMGFQSVPYVVALFSAMLWMYYAFLKKNAVLLISINSFGCIIQTFYISLYLYYASKSARSHTAKLLGLTNMGILPAIFVLTFFLFKDTERVHVVGWICVAVSVCVFAAPLSIMFQVIRTRSVEFMPFLLSFFLTLSAVMWFAYGLFERDLCVALPNVMGFLLGVLQMVLYGIYRKASKKPEIDEKKIGEHVMSIMVVGTDGDDPKSLSISPFEHGMKMVVEEEEDERKKEKNKGEEEVEPRNFALMSIESSHVNMDSPVLIVCAA